MADATLTGMSSDALVYQRDPSTLWRDAPGGVLLLVPDGDEPVLLSSPGDVVWQLLAQPSTLDELVAILSRHFSAADDAVRADLETLVTDLCAMGAVVTTSPGDPLAI